MNGLRFTVISLIRSAVEPCYSGARILHSWRTASKLMCVVLIMLRAPIAIMAQLTPAQAFEEAEDLFVNGKFEDAAQKYERLLAEGWVAPELFYNLGNAYFKAGQYGSAVLNYRRAWYLCPRDPDVLANLRFAFQTIGAPFPELSGAQRVLTYVSRSEWIIAGVAFWWLTWLFTVLAWISARFRALAIRGAALCALAFLICAAGYAAWQQFRTYPEYVVTEGRQDVRFAPLDNAVLHFVLPEGAIVRERERSGDWVKITVSQKEGWMRRQYLLPTLSAEVDATL